jgi:hypothetical protein
MDALHPIIQMLFKLIILLLILAHTGMYSKIGSIIIVLLCFIWMYPDANKIILIIMESSK